MVTFPGVLIPFPVNFPLRTETVSENVSYQDNVFSQASPVSKKDGPGDLDRNFVLFLFGSTPGP